MCRPKTLSCSLSLPFPVSVCVMGVKGTPLRWCTDMSNVHIGSTFGNMVQPSPFSQCFSRSNTLRFCFSRDFSKLCDERDWMKRGAELFNNQRYTRLSTTKTRSHLRTHTHFHTYLFTCVELQSKNHWSHQMKLRSKLFSPYKKAFLEAHEQATTKTLTEKT